MVGDTQKIVGTLDYHIIRRRMQSVRNVIAVSAAQTVNQPKLHSRERGAAEIFAKQIAVKDSESQGGADLAVRDVKVIMRSLCLGTEGPHTTKIERKLCAHADHRARGDDRQRWFSKNDRMRTESWPVNWKRSLFCLYPRHMAKLRARPLGRWSGVHLEWDLIEGGGRRDGALHWRKTSADGRTTFANSHLARGRSPKTCDVDRLTVDQAKVSNMCSCDYQRDRRRCQEQVKHEGLLHDDMK